MLELIAKQCKKNRTKWHFYSHFTVIFHFHRYLSTILLKKLLPTLLLYNVVGICFCKLGRSVSHSIVLSLSEERMNIFPHRLYLGFLKLASSNSHTGTLQDHVHQLFIIKIKFLLLIENQSFPKYCKVPNYFYADCF